LILLLFWHDGKFHPGGAGDGNGRPVGFEIDVELENNMRKKLRAIVGYSVTVA
jgi:hypothetical protein